LGDIWIEYKYIETIPKKGQVKIDLSALQKEWLLSRAQEGRNVAVIVGSKEGGIFLSSESITSAISLEEFSNRLQSRKDLADRIISITGTSHANSSIYNDRS
jgi:hypothetical protein